MTRPQAKAKLLFGTFSFLSAPNPRSGTTSLVPPFLTKQHCTHTINPLVYSRVKCLWFPRELFEIFLHSSKFSIGNKMMYLFVLLWFRFRFVDSFCRVHALKFLPLPLSLAFSSFSCSSYGLVFSVAYF